MKALAHLLEMFLYLRLQFCLLGFFSFFDYCFSLILIPFIPVLNNLFTGMSLTMDELTMTVIWTCVKYFLLKVPEISVVCVTPFI